MSVIAAAIILSDKQAVRLADVFLIGPFLIWVGFQFQLPKTIKIILIALGVLIILYNGYNFIQEDKKSACA